jgi:2-C-methyl-D-erythritol 4-phosphate cytidylyltransferase
MLKKYAIIVAGGSGKRMGSAVPKQFLELMGKPILVHTIERFFEAEIFNIILVLPASEINYWETISKEYEEKFNTIEIAVGGESRFQSVKNGLSKITENEGLVAIHDGVRPFISTDCIKKSFDIAREKGSAVVCVLSKDSVRIVKSDGTSEALVRNDIRMVQTPQTFEMGLIKKAYQQLESDTFTDDATVVEKLGHEIQIIEGGHYNFKITTPEDLGFAEYVFKNQLNPSI